MSRKREALPRPGESMNNPPSNDELAAIPADPTPSLGKRSRLMSGPVIDDNVSSFNSNASGFGLVRSKPATTSTPSGTPSVSARLGGNAATTPVPLMSSPAMPAASYHQHHLVSMTTAGGSMPQNVVVAAPLMSADLTGGRQQVSVAAPLMSLNFSREAQASAKVGAPLMAAFVQPVVALVPVCSATASSTVDAPALQVQPQRVTGHPLTEGATTADGKADDQQPTTIDKADSDQMRVKGLSAVKKPALLTMDTRQVSAGLSPVGDRKESAVEDLGAQQGGNLASVLDEVLTSNQSKKSVSVIHEVEPERPDFLFEGRSALHARADELYVMSSQEDLTTWHGRRTNEQYYSIKKPAVSDRAFYGKWSPFAMRQIQDKFGLSLVHIKWLQQSLLSSGIALDAVFTNDDVNSRLQKEVQPVLLKSLFGQVLTPSPDQPLIPNFDVFHYEKRLAKWLLNSSFPVYIDGIQQVRDRKLKEKAQTPKRRAQPVPTLDRPIEIQAEAEAADDKAMDAHRNFGICDFLKTVTEIAQKRLGNNNGNQNADSCISGHIQEGTDDIELAENDDDYEKPADHVWEWEDNADARTVKAVTNFGVCEVLRSVAQKEFESGQNNLHFEAMALEALAAGTKGLTTYARSSNRRRRIAEDNHESQLDEAMSTKFRKLREQKKKDREMSQLTPGEHDPEVSDKMKIGCDDSEPKPLFVGPETKLTGEAAKKNPKSLFGAPIPGALAGDKEIKENPKPLFGVPIPGALAGDNSEGEQSKSRALLSNEPESDLALPKLKTLIDQVSGPPPPPKSIGLPQQIENPREQSDFLWNYLAKMRPCATDREFCAALSRIPRGMYIVQEVLEGIGPAGWLLRVTVNGVPREVVGVNEVGSHVKLLSELFPLDRLLSFLVRHSITWGPQAQAESWGEGIRRTVRKVLVAVFDFLGKSDEWSCYHLPDVLEDIEEELPDYAFDIRILSPTETDETHVEEESHKCTLHLHSVIIEGVGPSENEACIIALQHAVALPFVDAPEATKEQWRRLIDAWKLVGIEAPGAQLDVRGMTAGINKVAETLFALLREAGVVEMLGVDGFEVDANIAGSNHAGAQPFSRPAIPDNPRLVQIAIHFTNLADPDVFVKSCAEATQPTFMLALSSALAEQREIFRTPAYGYLIRELTSRSQGLRSGAPWRKIIQELSEFKRRRPRHAQLWLRKYIGSKLQELGPQVYAKLLEDPSVGDALVFFRLSCTACSPNMEFDMTDMSGFVNRVLSFTNDLPMLESELVSIAEMKAAICHISQPGAQSFLERPSVVSSPPISSLIATARPRVQPALCPPVPPASGLSFSALPPRSIGIPRRVMVHGPKDSLWNKLVDLPCQGVQESFLSNPNEDDATEQLVSALRTLSPDISIGNLYRPEGGVCRVDATVLGSSVSVSGVRPITAIINLLVTIYPIEDLSPLFVKWRFRPNPLAKILEPWESGLLQKAWDTLMFALNYLKSSQEPDSGALSEIVGKVAQSCPDFSFDLSKIVGNEKFDCSMYFHSFWVHQSRNDALRAYLGAFVWANERLFPGGTSSGLQPVEVMQIIHDWTGARLSYKGNDNVNLPILNLCHSFSAECEVWFSVFGRPANLVIEKLSVIHRYDSSGRIQVTITLTRGGDVTKKHTGKAQTKPVDALFSALLSSINYWRRQDCIFAFMDLLETIARKCLSLRKFVGWPGVVRRLKNDSDSPVSSWFTQFMSECANSHGESVVEMHCLEKVSPFTAVLLAHLAACEHLKDFDPSGLVAKLREVFRESLPTANCAGDTAGNTLTVPASTAPPGGEVSQVGPAMFPPGPPPPPMFPGNARLRPVPGVSRALTAPVPFPHAPIRYPISVPHKYGSGLSLTDGNNVSTSLLPGLGIHPEQSASIDKTPPLVPVDSSNSPKSEENSTLPKTSQAARVKRAGNVDPLTPYSELVAFLKNFEEETPLASCQFSARFYTFPSSSGCGFAVECRYKAVVREDDDDWGTGGAGSETVSELTTHAQAAGSVDGCLVQALDKIRVSSPSGEYVVGRVCLALARDLCHLDPIPSEDELTLGLFAHIKSSNKMNQVWTNWHVPDPRYLACPPQAAGIDGKVSNLTICLTILTVHMHLQPRIRFDVVDELFSVHKETAAAQMDAKRVLDEDNTLRITEAFNKLAKSSLAQVSIRFSQSEDKRGFEVHLTMGLKAVDPIFCAPEPRPSVVEAFCETLRCVKGDFPERRFHGRFHNMMYILREFCFAALGSVLNICDPDVSTLCWTIAKIDTGSLVTEILKRRIGESSDSHGEARGDSVSVIREWLLALAKDHYTEGLHIFCFIGLHVQDSRLTDATAINAMIDEGLKLVPLPVSRL